MARKKSPLPAAAASEPVTFAPNEPTHLIHPDGTTEDLRPLAELLGVPPVVVLDPVVGLEPDGDEAGQAAPYHVESVAFIHPDELARLKRDVAAVLSADEAEPGANFLAGLLAGPPAPTYSVVTEWTHEVVDYEPVSCGTFADPGDLARPVDPSLLTLGNALRTARESAGKSMGEVARALGCPVMYVSDAERGRILPPDYWIRDFLSAIGELDTYAGQVEFPAKHEAAVATGTEVTNIACIAPTYANEAEEDGAIAFHDGPITGPTGTASDVILTWTGAWKWDDPSLVEVAVATDPNRGTPSHRTAMEETPDFPAPAEHLWKLLDDIDTLDDACRSDDAAFRRAVRAVIGKRWGWTPTAAHPMQDEAVREAVAAPLWEGLTVIETPRPVKWTRTDTASHTTGASVTLVRPDVWAVHIDGRDCGTVEKREKGEALVEKRRG
jgi:transcriptional regulator with XRE-family HTH domain